MRYCIVTSGIIENIVIAEADVAETINFLPWYDEAKIGDTYNPPPEPEPEPTLDERVSALETTKADHTDVDEVNEALDMILTGYTGEEATDAEGTAG